MKWFSKKKKKKKNYVVFVIDFSTTPKVHWKYMFVGKHWLSIWFLMLKPVAFDYLYSILVCVPHVLLLLSHFSSVRLLATPWTAAYQAPPSMGFSRQEYWSGLPLPSLVPHVLCASSLIDYLIWATACFLWD